MVSGAVTAPASAEDAASAVPTLTWDGAEATQNRGGMKSGTSGATAAFPSSVGTLAALSSSARG